MQIIYSTIESPIGDLYIYSKEEGIVFLTWDKDEFKKFKYDVKENQNVHIIKAKEQLKKYFDGKLVEFDLSLCFLEGTEFQKKVWETLRKIPYGTTISYEEEAIRLGDKNKTRAVGGANGKNPIPIIIPCHRVIRKDNSLGGFSGGLDKKEFLLNLEKENLKICQT